jgi:hypothetical protein
VGIPSLYESPEAARAAPKLSDDGRRAFRRFDLRHGLVTDRGTRPSPILLAVLVALLGLVLAGWFAGWLELPELP